MECPELLIGIRKLALEREPGKERPSTAGLRREYRSHGCAPVCKDDSQMSGIHSLIQQTDQENLPYARLVLGSGVTGLKRNGTLRSSSSN